MKKINIKHHEIAKEIAEIWDKKKNIEIDLRRWINELKNGQEACLINKSKFYNRGCLKTYVSVSGLRDRAKSNFSVRFYGEVVADLIVDKNGNVGLKLIKEQCERFNKRFKTSLTAGTCLWTSQKAKEFGKHFEKLSIDSEGQPKLHGEEHRIESKFITEMQKGANKFGLNGLRLKPVLIAKKFPLQIPVPISGSTGVPKFSTGHIDILARNGNKLCVWELKRFGEYKNVASQAYIYAVTLLYVLRKSKSGAEWYKLFGFNSPIPRSLDIEAVVAVDIKQKESFDKELRNRFDGKTSFQIEGMEKDTIKLFVAYYKEEPNGITLEKNPFLV